MRWPYRLESFVLKMNAGGGGGMPFPVWLALALLLVEFWLLARSRILFVDEHFCISKPRRFKLFISKLLVCWPRAGAVSITAPLIIWAVILLTANESKDEVDEVDFGCRWARRRLLVTGSFVATLLPLLVLELNKRLLLSVMSLMSIVSLCEAETRLETACGRLCRELKSTATLNSSVIPVLRTWAAVSSLNFFVLDCDAETPSPSENLPNFLKFFSKHIRMEMKSKLGFQLPEENGFIK